MENIIKFKCESCGRELEAVMFDEDKQDKVHCDCGKVWVVIRPIETVEEE